MQSHTIDPKTNFGSNIRKGIFEKMKGSSSEDENNSSFIIIHSGSIFWIQIIQNMGYYPVIIYVTPKLTIHLSNQRFDINPIQRCTSHI